MERVYETHGDGLTCIKLRHGMIQHHCKNNEIFPWFSRLCLKLSNKLRSLLYGVNAFSPTPASYLPHPLYLCQGPSTLSYQCSWVQLGCMIQSQLVVKEFTLVSSKDYDNTFSLVFKLTSLFLSLSEHAPTKYQECFLKSYVFIKKSLCMHGLKQMASSWFKIFFQFCLRFGFYYDIIDLSLFVYCTNIMTMIDSSYLYRRYSCLQQ